MNTQLKKYEMALPLGSLDTYIHWANQIPLLTEEEEKDLANKLYYENDVEAARKLILPHLRFVIRIARGYKGYGLALGDLIQEGNIGLMKAIKRFNPEVGVRLVSFAVHWIKAEIHEFVLKNWRIVKVATTKAQRKLFFNLRKAAQRLGWFTNDEVKDVAAMLNVKPEEVRRMEARLNAYDESFDMTASQDSDEKVHLAPEQYLEDRRYDPARLIESKDWSDQREIKLADALTQLDARSQDILQQRWLAEKKATLHDLAAKYKVSAERIRQIEQLAMKKLKNQIESQ